MNNYPKHVGDFIRDTVGLSMLEDGAYNRLLDQYYARERPLPLDKAVLYRMARCTSAAERKAVDYVLTAYFTPGDDGWHQKRCDEELVAFNERSESARIGAAASVAARRAKAQRTFNERSTDAAESLAIRSTSQKPVASNQETTKAEPSSGVVVEKESGEPIDLWCKYRQEKGYPLGPTERALAIARLADHDDPKGAVERAIHRGSKYIDPPEKYRAKKPETVTETRARVADEMYGNLLRGREKNDAPRDITGESERVA